MVEARPRLPGFIKRTVMSPLGGAVPTLCTPDCCWFKGKPLIRTDSFQMELNLSTLHPSSCHAAPLPALTSSPPPHPPQTFSPSPAIPFPLSEKYNSQGGPLPLASLISPRKEDCDSPGWHSQGERRGEREICTFDRRGEKAGEGREGEKEGRRGAGGVGSARAQGRKTEGRAVCRDTQMQTDEGSGPWDQKLPSGADGHGGVGRC